MPSPEITNPFDALPNDLRTTHVSVQHEIDFASIFATTESDKAQLATFSQRLSELNSNQWEELEALELEVIKFKRKIMPSYD